MKKFAVKTTALLIAAGVASAAWSAESLQDVMKRRSLSQQDLLAAAKTYVPTGKRDEFVAFSSGGQSGQIIVYGIPSMRILKYIGVFTPEPWQGYGFDEESRMVLRQGNIDGKEIKMTVGKTLEKYGVAPVIIDGRTFVPVRFVADELGATIAWDDATKTVTITKIEK